MKFPRITSSTVLSIFSAAGVVATVATAIHATPKAMQLIEEIPEEERTPQQIIKKTWKVYVPTILSGVATIGCIFGSNALNKKQQATMMSAYALLEQSYKRYREHREEIFKVLEEKAKEELDEDESSMIDTDKKYKFVIDTYRNKVFERAFVEIQDAEYKLNQKFSMDGEVCLNDFFELLGLERHPLGDKIGWSQEYGLDFYNYSWIEFEHLLERTEDGDEVYRIHILLPPIYGYDSPRYLWDDVPFDT